MFNHQRMKATSVLPTYNDRVLDAILLNEDWMVAVIVHIDQKLSLFPAEQKESVT